MKLSKVSKNTLALFSAQIYNKLIGIIFFGVAARLLGVVSFGKYTLILTFISFFYILSDGGLSTLTIRNVSRAPEKTKEYLNQTIILRIFLAVISYLALIGLGILLAYSREIIILIAIIGLSIFTNNILNSFNAILSAHEKMYIPSGMGIIFSTLNLILGISCLYLGFGLIGLTLLLVFTTLINSIVTGYIIRNYLLPIKPSLDFKLYITLIKQALPYAVLSLLSIVYFRIDTIMLSKLKTIEAVGLYNAGYKIIEALLFLPVCLTGAFFPRMSRQVKFDIAELQANYLKTTKLLLAVILPLAVLCTFFAKDIITTIFGPKFAGSAQALQILIWAAVVMYINAPVGNILYNSDKLFRFIPYAILNTSLNIGLNFIFIPKWSYLGASFTTLATEITGFLIQIYFIKHILNTLPNLLKETKLFIYAGLAMAISIIVLKNIIHPSLFIMGLSVIVYSGIIMSSKGFRQDCLRSILLKEE